MDFVECAAFVRWLEEHKTMQMMLLATEYSKRTKHQNAASPEQGRMDDSTAALQAASPAFAAPEALALLRELNDALAIPGWLQPRVDAVLDRAEEK